MDRAVPPSTIKFTEDPPPDWFLFTNFWDAESNAKTCSFLKSFISTLVNPPIVCAPPCDFTNAVVAIVVFVATAVVELVMLVL